MTPRPTSLFRRVFPRSRRPEAGGFTPSDAGRALAAQRITNERERFKAVARQMCLEMGRDIPEALR